MGFIVAVIVAIGLGAGVHALMNGTITVNWSLIVMGLFGSFLLFLLGGIFSRDHNKDRDINGEIEGTLQSFTDQHARLLYQLMAGKPVEDKLEAIEGAEEEFRANIEYGVVTDGTENYYSYKGGQK